MRTEDDVAQRRREATTCPGARKGGVYLRRERERTTSGERPTERSTHLAFVKRKKERRGLNGSSSGCRERRQSEKEKDRTGEELGRETETEKKKERKEDEGEVTKRSQRRVIVMGKKNQNPVEVCYVAIDEEKFLRNLSPIHCIRLKGGAPEERIRGKSKRRRKKERKRNSKK